MLDWLKRIVARTPLANPARRLVHRFNQPTTAAEKNARYDAETLDVMRRVLKVNSNCVDVGAHCGSVLRQMLELAPNGEHLAFEPLPGFAEHLRTSFPQVRVFEVALSDNAGPTTFQHVVTNPAYSGLRQRNYPSDHEDIRDITVNTDRLDSLVADGYTAALIKIDVEGAELGVLRGAIGVIKRSRPYIVFEHGLGAANHYGTVPGDVYDLLSGQCGLKVSLMRRWLSGEPPLSRAAFIRLYERGREFYYLADP